MSTLTIGELAKKINLNIQTIRYYERKGILPPPQRRISGYREYSQRDVNRLHFIKKAQNLGFTLKEVCELLNLNQHKEDSCPKICAKEQVESKIEVLDQKIKELKQIRTALSRLSKECEGWDIKESCPILNFMENFEDEKKEEDHAKKLK